MVISIENDRKNIKVLNYISTKNIIHRVECDETIESIAKDYCQTKETLLKINNLKNQVKEGMRILIPQKNTAIYVVKPLDTLSKIAKQFGKGENEIKKMNDIEKIFIGQILII